MNKTKTLVAIDTNLEQRQGSSFRAHLGSSVIGRRCSRQLWYMFRWARDVRHNGRMLRLFDRGNLEEDRFITWLRRAGIHVVNTDPETQQQYRIVDHNGHFGGSLDGMAYDTPDFPAEWVLTEFKTHNDKSFKELVKKGVKIAKWEHYVQMQIYMHYTGLRHALYFAINKNDDTLHLEIVEYDEVTALHHVDKAGKIIGSPVPPDRLKDASPGIMDCRFCDFCDICHFNKPKAVNCRTCVHAAPIEDGKWLCQKYQVELSERQQTRGCADHQMIPE